MKKIYEVGGTLNKGFVGQISYTVCLEGCYQDMDIYFTFGRQRYHDEEITEELKQELVDGYGDEYPSQIKDATDGELEQIIRGMKTEIHTIATMNDVFIGGIHRQSAMRHMCFSATEATEGCIPQPSVNGVVKVTLVVFNVILDDTPYTLSLSVN